MDKVKVLNLGSIEVLDSMGTDLSIVRAARQSYNAEWRTGKDSKGDANLIKYLLKNKHTGPFEHVVITFGIKAPIFVVRQWHRHRTQSYSEISARYTTLQDGFFIPKLGKVGVQSESNKQGSEFPGNTDQDKIVRELMYLSMEESFKTYQTLLDFGVPRERARSVLPMATYTQFSATANLHNWFNFLRLRLHKHAQYEIRIYAQAMLIQILELYPVATQAFIETLTGEHAL